jgi:hypothetical protein
MCSAFGQLNVYTSEGLPALSRVDLVDDCLQALHKDRSDPTALAICECRADQLDGRFSRKEYKKYTKKNIIDLAGLILTDSLLGDQLQQCYTSSGKTVLIEAESFESDFMRHCRISVQGSAKKILDSYNW